MKFCYALFAILVTVTLVTAKAAPQVGLPADHTIETRSPLAIKLQADAQHYAAVTAAEETVGQAKPKRGDAYSDAYKAGLSLGKMCVYIGATWCPNCPAAKTAFREHAVASGGSCVELDSDKDGDYVREIIAGHKRGKSIPQVIVYRVNGSGEYEFESIAIGPDAAKIKSVMLPRVTSAEVPCDAGTAGSGAASPGPVVSFASHRSACHCQNCPADCAANGCHCQASQSGSGAAQSCGGWYTPGQPVRNVARGTVRLGQKTVNFFQEHKPVRRTLATIGRALTPPCLRRCR